MRQVRYLILILYVAVAVPGSPGLHLLPGMGHDHGHAGAVAAAIEQDLSDHHVCPYHHDHGQEHQQDHCPVEDGSCHICDWSVLCNAVLVAVSDVVSNDALIVTAYEKTGWGDSATLFTSDARGPPVRSAFDA